MCTFIIIRPMKITNILPFVNEPLCKHVMGMYIPLKTALLCALQTIFMNKKVV